MKSKFVKIALLFSILFIALYSVKNWNALSFSIKKYYWSALEVEEILERYKKSGVQFTKLWYENKIHEFDELLKKDNLGAQQRISNLYKKANFHLYLGETQKALNVLGALREEKIADSLNEYQKQKISELYAISNLRMGEQVNCVDHHNHQSCIFPFKNQGVHQNKMYALVAVSVYEKLLGKYPYRRDYYWLLNIARSAAGLLPTQSSDFTELSQFFKSKPKQTDFEDEAFAMGIINLSGEGSVIVDDFDNDRKLDIVFSGKDENSTLKFFHREGEYYVNRSTEFGLDKITGGENIVQADFDNDGFTDILVLRGAWKGKFGKVPSTLLHNEGGKYFTDITKKSGLLFFESAQVGAWGDFNNDGWLDLAIATESDQEGNPGRVLLFQNNKDGTFSEVSQKMGINALGHFKSVSWGDFNNDGWQDLYVTSFHGKNLLYKNLGALNNGVPKFVNIANELDILGQGTSLQGFFWDFNNDGFLDIGVTNFLVESWDQLSNPASLTPSTSDNFFNYYLSLSKHSNQPRAFPIVYKNIGGKTFSDVTAELDLKIPLMGMGINYGDIDNSGYKSLYFATGRIGYEYLIPDRAFKNSNGTKFKDITLASGLGHLQKTHGIAFADLNNDGLQDIVAVHGGWYPGDTSYTSVFVNQTKAAKQNSWIKLKLFGVQSNKSAIGARIKVIVEVENKQVKEFYSYVNSGAGFGASPLLQQVGLGKAKKIIKIEVLWPGNNYVQNFYGAELNSYYEIVEGSVDMKKIKF